VDSELDKQHHQDKVGYHDYGDDNGSYGQDYPEEDILVVDGEPLPDEMI
jgi:hypothetical protein